MNDYTLCRVIALPLLWNNYKKIPTFYAKRCKIVKNKQHTPLSRKNQANLLKKANKELNLGEVNNGIIIVMLIT
jgi:hypothetical protein